MRRGLNLLRSIVTSCVIAICGVGAASCVQEPPRQPEVTVAIYKTATFHGDTSFTPQERAIVEEALSRWRAQTSGLIQAVVVWDMDFNSISSISEHQNDNLVIRWTSENSKVQMHAAENPGSILLGWSPGRIEPNPDGPARVHLVVDALELTRIIHQPFAEEGYLAVTMHEFGHVFGLHHVEDESGLMKAGWIGGHACLSKEDVSEFCRVNECGDVKITPCNRWK